RGHAEVQKEMTIAGHEREDAFTLGGYEIERRHVWRQHPDQQRRRRAISVVAFVAHLECLRDQRPEIDAARATDRIAEPRTERVTKPSKTFDDFRSVRAVSQDLAEAFVERRVRAVAVRSVRDDD